MTDMSPVPARRRLPCCDLERSEAMEKYLRAIYLLSFKAPPVSTSQVAARLGVAPPSVSAMLRRLGAAGLLAASDSAGIALSEHGERHATDVIRRHRLIETFLVRAVGMRWDEVHAEAEALQHAASELLIERIDSVLGIRGVIRTVTRSRWRQVIMSKTGLRRSRMPRRVRALRWTA